MKTSIVLVLCLIAIASSQMTLIEIDDTKFGHTLLDTIYLQLKNLPSGALSGPPKIIYDMLTELLGSLEEEQTDDTNGLDRMCIECTSTINEYKVKVDDKKYQMRLDDEELTSLRSNMDHLRTEVHETGNEVDRLTFLLQFLLDSHNEQLEAVDVLISEANNVRDALIQAKTIIEQNLLSQSALLLQTAAGVSISNHLARIESSYKGYATLALEFMELASNEDVVSDQGMAGELLNAFDELIEQCNNDVTKLQTQRGNMVTEYENTKGPVEQENSAATRALQEANNNLNQAISRVDSLKEKVTADENDVEAWGQFVVDEGMRCTQEESSYNTRIAERSETIRVVKAVIELFEEKFVEMNDYINSQVRMQDGDIVSND